MNKLVKLFIIFGFIGLGLFALGLFTLFCIGAGGLIVYGRMYLFDGYEITAILSALSLIEIFFGSFVSFGSFITSAVIKACAES